MNLLVVSQYFQPENFRVNDLVEGMVARGHTVTVLTGQPNYPSGAFPPGYGWFGKRRERLLGAEILRVPLCARKRGGAVRLALNYLSFAACASLAALFRLRGRFDAIFVFAPSPITVAIPAIVAAKRFHAPMLVWVLDLWPESVAAAGGVRNKSVLGALARMVDWIYRKSARILIQSKAFVPSIAAYGVENARISYFPNWIEPVYRDTAEPAAAPDDMPEGFRIVYAGNIGEAQDFPAILAAAELVAKTNPEVRWVIAGDGRMGEWVRGEVDRRGLSERFRFLGQLPASRMPGLFAAADALLVSLRPEPVFELTIPGKVQSYLAAGRPVLAMLDGEGARVVQEAQAGLTCPAGDAPGLAAIVASMAAATPETRACMGDRAQAYAVREFDREMLFDALDGWLRDSVQA